MITINGKSYPTVSDGAKELGVSVKTIGQWITKGIIDTPPTIEYGTREMGHYTPEYITQAKLDVKKRRKDNKAKRKMQVHNSN